MKIIVFDLLSSQPKNGITFHGGGEYIKTIYKEFINMIKHKNCDLQVYVCYNEDEFIDEWIKKSFENNFIYTENAKYETDIVSKLYELGKNGDITFFTGMIYLYTKDKAKFPKDVRTIGTCHGLRTLEKPYDPLAYKYGSVKNFFKELLRITICRKFLYRKYLNEFRKSLENFDVIITVSEHSASAIKVFLSELADIDVRVCYTPMKVSVRSDKVTDGKYFMMVSADRWLKNAFRGLCAVDDLYSKGYLKGIRTKVYGNYPDKLKAKLKNIDNYDFFGYVDSDVLENAYANCSVFFYPTLNEGFGLPPMEAMKYDKTCIVSGVCSLPEVYGDSVYYCNPYDIPEMENRLLTAIEKKIEPYIIRKRLEYISNKQNEDLKKICRLIIGD